MSCTTEEIEVRKQRVTHDAAVGLISNVGGGIGIQDRSCISLLGIQSKLKLFLKGMGDRGKFLDAKKAFFKRFTLKH